MADDLGVVILCHGPDAQEHVRPLVVSIVEQDVAPANVTIVHNSNSTDAPFEAPLTGVDVIRPGRNLGYAGGMNLGIRDHQLKGRDLILLLTMDVRIDSGAVARLREAASRSTKYGIFGPELRWTGTDRTTWGARWNGVGKVDHVLVRPVDGDADGIVESDSIDGAVVLIRAKVLEDVGPLHDHLFMYFEETEFCLRAKRAGWQVGVVLGAVAEQSSGETRRPGAFNYLMARNGLEFARLVAGWRGVIAALSRDLMQSWRLIKMRISPKSDDRRRRFAMVSLTGLWLGVLAFVRRRWGPPPGNLPGSGDMTFAR